MWQTLPAEDQGPSIWAGELEPTSPNALRLDRPRRRGQQESWSERQFYERARAAADDLPLVSIGAPTILPLRTMYPPKALPPLMAHLMESKDYYFLRCVCTFRPKRDQAKIERARFEVALLSDEKGNQPLVFDLDPQSITQGVKHHRKVTISPSITFSDVEASPGSAEWGWEYLELRPVVSADGGGESRAGWDYSAEAGFWIKGSYWMHLIVEAPRGMPKGRALLQLSATAVSDGLRFPVWPKKQNEEEREISVTLWE